MAVITIDGYILKKAIILGANELERNKDYVDSLNVFPVPDGDTGINMALTVIAAAKEAVKTNTPNIYEVAKAASNGSLRGARGNSGVILSQLFRGFAKGLEGKAVANTSDLAEAFLKGAQTAYKAVMKPKEGTILTIARVFAEYAAEMAYSTEDIPGMLKESLEYAFKILDKTTEMLPELKQANVIDAGGRGFLYILEGALASCSAKGDVKLIDPAESKTILLERDEEIYPASIPQDIKFGYCTEFFIDMEKDGEEASEGLKAYLSGVGDSIVVVADEDIIKVHVHTNNPGLVIERALTLGSLSSVKIDNMRLQHNNLINFTRTNGMDEVFSPNMEDDGAKDDDTAFIAVAAGEGMGEMFRKLGADMIVEGGQSMNPSTDDILKSIDKITADNIYILPNNKNIILAAEQAAALSEKNIYVVHSKSVPHGVAAIVSYVPGFTPEENLFAMDEAMANVKTAAVTYAVRSSAVDGITINGGDILGLLDDKIKFSDKDITEVTKALIDRLFEEASGNILSIYYGKEIDEKEANGLREYAEKEHPGCEGVVMNGGQPVYYYILSLE